MVERKVMALPGVFVCMSAIVVTKRLTASKLCQSRIVLGFVLQCSIPFLKSIAELKESKYCDLWTQRQSDSMT